ncbi:hypothetical protein B0H14DRAFT_3485295 [Mycena olivaceomarginata]|nr:hypothetical protein B0H14DRAFT_3485295 [Mycena olivaceomarginata]
MPGLLTRNVRGAVEIHPRDIRLGGDFVLPRSDAVFDHGPDLPPEARLGEQPQKTYAGEIFTRIIAEVFSLIGINMDRTRAYCHLSPDQRALVGPETFQDENLLTYFPAVYWSDDHKQWDRVATLLFRWRRGKEPAGEE